MIGVPAPTYAKLLSFLDLVGRSTRSCNMWSALFGRENFPRSKRLTNINSIYSAYSRDMRSGGGRQKLVLAGPETCRPSPGVSLVQRGLNQSAGVG